MKRCNMAGWMFCSEHQFPGGPPGDRSSIFPEVFCRAVGFRPQAAQSLPAGRPRFALFLGYSSLFGYFLGSGCWWTTGVDSKQTDFIPRLDEFLLHGTRSFIGR